MTRSFCPADFCFEWTEDWYSWDSIKARKLALAARNAQVREWEERGYEVLRYTMSNQLVSRGGVGSGHPHIELVVNVYCCKVVEFA